jgi:RNA polymerase sigma-B factor
VRADEATGLLAVRARGGDDDARDELVERMQPVVAAVARRFERLAPRADLEQAGAVGVLDAIRGFDAGRGTSFEAYANQFMLGEMLACVRQSTSLVRVPRGIREASRAVEATIEAFQREHARSPTVAEIAARAGLDEERVVEALGARRLMQPAPADDAELERLGDDDATIEAAERRLAIQSSLRRLDARSRRILALRFGAGLSQSEIAARVGLSQMHISRLLRAAVRQLEEEME